MCFWNVVSKCPYIFCWSGECGICLEAPSVLEHSFSTQLETDSLNLCYHYMHCSSKSCEWVVFLPDTEMAYVCMCIHVCVWCGVIQGFIFFVTKSFAVKYAINIVISKWFNFTFWLCICVHQCRIVWERITTHQRICVCVWAQDLCNVWGQKGISVKTTAAEQWKSVLLTAPTATSARKSSLAHTTPLHSG